MDSEDIGLDFDCGISPQEADHQAWHSDEEDSSDHHESEDSEPPKDDKNKSEDGDTIAT